MYRSVVSRDDKDSRFPSNIGTLPDYMALHFCKVVFIFTAVSTSHLIQKVFQLLLDYIFSHYYIYVQVFVIYFEGLELQKINWYSKGLL